MSDKTSAQQDQMTRERIMQIVRYSTVGSKAVPESEWVAFARAIEHELRAAQQVQADAWQPIETAPKDGTRIFLKSPQGRIADGDWGKYGVWSWPYVMVEPTHWMPLNAIQHVQADAGAVAWLQIGIGVHEGTRIARTHPPEKWNSEWWRFEPLYLRPAAESEKRFDHGRWIRDNYQDYPNISTLISAMNKAECAAMSREQGEDK